MKFAAILLATALAALAALGADEPTADPELIADPFSDAARVEKEPPPTQAAFLFEWIELDHRQANKLVRKNTDQLSAQKLRKQLGKLIDDKQATLVQTAYLNTKQQQRAKTQSVDEQTYPTEYDPPEIPMEIFKHTRDGELIIIPATPTAFDVRLVGTTVEVEPDISEDGKTITVEFHPEIVAHLGDRGVGGNAEKVPEPLATIRQPVFYVMKMRSRITLAVNDFTLAGILAPPGKPDKRVLLIVRTKVSY